MDTQFTDLSILNPNESFYCSPLTQSSGFTLLMKLVLRASNPNAIKLIKEIISKKRKLFTDKLAQTRTHYRKFFIFFNILKINFSGKKYEQLLRVADQSNEIRTATLNF